MASMIAKLSADNTTFTNTLYEHHATIECSVNKTNNTQGDRADLSTLNYYFDGILSLIVITLGLIGNGLTIVVLTRRIMRSSTNCYLTALAIWDSLVLVITLFLITLPAMSMVFQTHYMPYVVVYIYPLGLIAQTTTIWLTLSFTVERYIAVCHPLRSASMCTIERARHVIISVSVASFLYNIVRWFDYAIVYHCDIVTGTLSNVRYAPTSFVRNDIYQNIYYAWLYPLMMSLIPLISLAILNTFLIMAVRRSNKQQHSMNVRQSRENNVTIMLVSVVIVFITCQLPAMVYNVAQAYNMHIAKQYTSWAVVSIVRNFLVNLNSAVNFILYCTFGQKFRRIFMRTFCRCFLSDEEFNSLTYHVAGGMNAVNTNQSVRRGVPRKKKYKRNVYDMSSSASTRASTTSRNSQRSHESPAAHVNIHRQMNGNLTGPQKELVQTIIQQKNKTAKCETSIPESREVLLQDSTPSGTTEKNGACDV